MKKLLTRIAPLLLIYAGSSLKSASEENSLEGAQFNLIHHMISEGSLNERHPNLIHNLVTFGVPTQDDTDTIKALKALKRAHGLIDLRDEEGLTPLQRAANAGDEALCKALIDLGADPLRSVDGSIDGKGIVAIAHPRIRPLLIETIKRKSAEKLESRKETKRLKGDYKAPKIDPINSDEPIAAWQWVLTTICGMKR